MKSLRKRFFWTLLAAVFLPVLVFGVWFGQQARQQNLDRALIAAIKRDDTKGAIALLDQGADANAKDKSYKPTTLKSVFEDWWNRIKSHSSPQEAKVYTPALLVHYDYRLYKNAAGEPLPIPEDVPLMKALLQHGANANAIDDNYHTALMKISVQDHCASVELLLAYGANVRLKNRYGLTPLHWANGKCLGLLVKHGAEINAKTKNGETPLIDAIGKYGEAKKQALLDLGADVNSQNNAGETPVMVAIRIHDFSALRLIVNHQANVNLQDKQGRTALMYAVEDAVLAESDHFNSRIAYGTVHEDTTRLLIQHGARVSIKDREGKTALDYANKLKQKALISLLEAAQNKEQAQSGNRP